MENDSDDIDENNICSICLESLMNQNNYYTHETCRKKFHICCIDRWIVERLNLYEHNVSCPLCRQSLNKNPDIQNLEEFLQETSTTTESENSSDDETFLDELAENVFVLNRDSIQFNRLHNLLNRNGYPFDGVVEFCEQPEINVRTESFHIRINDYSSSSSRNNDNDNDDDNWLSSSRGVVNVLIDRRELRSGFYLSLRKQ